MLSLLRAMLPSVGGFAISSDGYFCIRKVDILFSNRNSAEIRTITNAFYILIKYKLSRLFVTFEAVNAPNYLFNIILSHFV